MERFLIELPHEAEKVSCLKAIRILLTSGSHYLTHSEFGCFDGVHKSWIIVEADSKDEARSFLPPLYRSEAQIVKLTKFSVEQVDEMLKKHGSEPEATA
jgi:hypothetical protein